MADRVDQIQEKFNKLGSELLQVELGLVRFKEALTKANDRKHTIMQKLVNLDDEFQKIKYSGLKPVEPTEEKSDEIKFKEAVVEAPSAATEQPTAG